MKKASGTPEGWNGDLATLTDDELAAYGKHCLRLGVHPNSTVMRAVLTEMQRRKPGFLEEYRQITTGPRKGPES